MTRKRTWLVILTLMASASGAAAADSRSENVLKRLREVAPTVRTLTADMITTTDSGGQVDTTSYSLRLMRPNFAQIRFTDNAGKPKGALMSDGKELYVVTEEVKRYRKSAAAPQGQNLGGVGGLYSPVSAFFNPERLLAREQPRYVGQLNEGGRVFQILEVRSNTPPQSRKLFFGSTGLLEGVELRYAQTRGSRIVSTWLKNLRTNTAMTAREFAYSPPSGYRPYKAVSSDRGLLEVGREGPDFTAVSADGSSLYLAEARKGKKATLLYFWFQGSTTCLADLVELQKLYAEQQSRGLEVIAVNWKGSPQVLAAYVKESKLSFPVVLSGNQDSVASAYKVSAYPTFYLLDESGKIRWRATGSHLDDLKKELRALGF